MSFKLFIYFIFACLLFSKQGYAQDYSFIDPNSTKTCLLIEDEAPVENIFKPLALPLILETKNQNNFFKLVNLVQKKFNPVFKKHDLDVFWKIDWDSQVENAFAAPNGGGYKRQLKIYGGLYRHELVTADGYLFVLCHEVGHLLGGAPVHAFYPELSAEGQADYYSTNTCLPIVLSDQDNISYIKKLNVPFEVKSKCDHAWKKTEDSAICQRSIMAAYSFSKFLMRAMNGAEISFTKHDSEKVDETKDAYYPEKQCRFDTAMAGALCVKKLNSIQEVGDSANCSLQQMLLTHAARPQCWFKTPGK